jgi:hypothetical protein
MPFTLSYVNAHYKQDHKPAANVNGFGLICETMEQAIQERDRIQNLFKVESVTIDEKTFGGTSKW